MEVGSKSFGICALNKKSDYSKENSKQLLLYGTSPTRATNWRNNRAVNQRLEHIVMVKKARILTTCFFTLDKSDFLMEVADAFTAYRNLEMST